MKQTKFQLKNKMNVLLIESHKSPVVSVQMWVKTGSADEKKSEEGISHFIEHLVFKGTEKFKVGEIANLVEASGGELNAYTSFDQTVFYVTISKNFSDVALDVVSQMMGYPTFDASEVDSEREVVCEEIKMGQDSPGRKSSQLMFSTAFKKHPYGIPVIGYDKNVRSWPVAKIKKFYQSRYVPSNMFLVVSGDFESKEMRAQVEKFFAGFQPFKLRTVKRTKEPAQTKFRYKALNYKIQDQHLHFVFKAPSIRHKDVAALDVLAVILGQGDSSYLVKKLRLEKPLVSSISAFNYNPQDEGLFAISANYQDSKFDEISREILAQVRVLQTENVSWADIKRARVALSSEQFYSVETVEGLANKAGTQEFYFKDQNAQKKYLQQVGKITPEDVKKVAKKYFKLEKLSAAYLGDRAEAEAEKDLKKIPTLWKEIFKGTVKKQNKKDKKIKIPNLALKATTQTKSENVEKVTLDSGIKILFRKQSDTPTVSAKWVYRGGARLETEKNMGLSELTSQAWISGTKTRSESELLQEIEESAIGLSAFNGKNTCGLSIDYLSAFEDKALELTMDSLLNSSVQPEVVEREKQILRQAIKSREDHPGSQCMRQFMKLMFGEHPLAFETIGTQKTLDQITDQDISNLIGRLKTSSDLTIAVVGDFDRKKWMANLKNLEKQLKKTEKPYTTSPLAPLQKSQRAFLPTQKEQSHVIIGWRALSLSDPERYTLQAIEAILAGQGGRLFFELRDKNSLAYSVSPMRMESLETGYFGGYIACSHEKVEKAIEMFRQEFQKLRDVPVGAEELARAQKYLIGQHDIGLQKKSAICNLLAFDEIYGNDYNESLNVAEQYKKITPQHILDLAESLFSKNDVISIVGREGAKFSI